MIKLPEIRFENSEAFCGDTYERVYELLVSHKKESGYEKIISYCSDDNGLNKNKIKSLLTGRKKSLENAIDIIGIIHQEAVINEFERLYKNFCNRKFGNRWAEINGVTVCPYCNRNYIFTSKKRGTRPQYDHYFPKSKYPYLALSMYNLIPCCSVCNSLKHDKDTSKNPIIYPYEDSYGEQAKFTAEGVDGTDIEAWLGASEKYKIKIEYKRTIAADLKSRIEESFNLFQIQDLYEKHSDYIQNIFRIAYIYSDDYFAGLLEKYPDLFHSEKEARNFVYFNYLDEKDWGKRVLAKLTHDIVNETEFD